MNDTFIKMVHIAAIDAVDGSLANYLARPPTEEECLYAIDDYDAFLKFYRQHPPVDIPYLERFIEMQDAPCVVAMQDMFDWPNGEFFFYNFETLVYRHTKTVAVDSVTKTHNKITMTDTHGGEHVISEFLYDYLLPANHGMLNMVEISKSLEFNRVLTDVNDGYGAIRLMLDGAEVLCISGGECRPEEYRYHGPAYPPLFTYHSSNYNSRDYPVESRKPGKIVMVVGLPGSGKTSLLNKLRTCMKKYSMYEDNDHRIDGVDFNFTYPVMILDDPGALDLDKIARFKVQGGTVFLAHASTTVVDYGIIGDEFIFFENDPDQCIANLKTRETDEKRLQDLIQVTRELAEKYTPGFKERSSRVYPVYKPPL